MPFTDGHGTNVLDAACNTVMVDVSRNIHALADCGSDCIVAVVPNGFSVHFFRRDRVTQRWGWKDRIGAGRTDEMTDFLSWLSTTVDDAPFIRVVDTQKAEYAPNWQAKAFHSPFGPGNTDDMTVSGVSYTGDGFGGVFG